MLPLHAIEDVHGQQIGQLAANRQRRRVAQGAEGQPHALRGARRGLNRANGIADAGVGFESRRAGARPRCRRAARSRCHCCSVKSGSAAPKTTFICSMASSQAARRRETAGVTSNSRRADRIDFRPDVVEHDTRESLPRELQPSTSPPGHRARCRSRSHDRCPTSCSNAHMSST